MNGEKSLPANAAAGTHDEMHRNTFIGTRGYIEGVLVNPIDGSGVVFGWVVKGHDDIRVILNVSDGTSIQETEIVWTSRPDVLAANRGTTKSIYRPGFVALLPPGNMDRRLLLIASDSLRINLIAKSEIPKMLPVNPGEAAQILFGIQTEIGIFSDRCKKIDGIVISPLIEAHRHRYRNSSVLEEVIGAPPVEPSVSIIIPLYHRYDFLENQILEFVRDEWIRSNAEVIYVIDDPNITDQVRALAQKMHALTNFSFRLIWNNMNGGFSLANNLGAAYSRGRHLLFLNSDVIPHCSGWLETLTDTLESDPKIGVVGARLLLPNGGLQHNGMEFRYDYQLSIWINDHPFVGIDPTLLNDDRPHSVEALTGACMLIDRNVFDETGGWDASYLIGDFEDSDLCLKLRSKGLDCWLDPRVTLIHLERQSFSTIGDSSFRTKAALFNSVRQMSKWGKVIKEIHDVRVS